MEEKSVFETFELELDNDIKGFLKETSSWSYFLSILGFIGIGIMILFGVFFGAFMGSFMGGINPYQNLGFSMGYLGLIYVVIGILYFFPVYYLFNFSKKMKNALKTNNNHEFKMAFSNLKSHYKFMGMFVIVIFSIYALIFIFGIFAALL
ncbi:DUF5362 family protein [Confluentibacter sediminis]|uniref:DUF5362 family protein n=1 Tax=Confluentibacter sediminis TaxID=2219045 RepID=UPI000DAEF562|nr:DUF5362 family protein [Confluentibacter sediminis]